jgi:uncharacterized protein (DUF697 family)
VRDSNSRWLDAESHVLLESACGTGAVAEWREAELASELLELASQPELDRFFRDLIRSEVPRANAAAPALKAILCRAATQVLPLVGKPPGEHCGPAGAPLGLELAGLSAQDQEFELARRFVRFASAAAREMTGPDAGSSPGASARAAAARAAESHAPGLLSALAGDEPGAALPGGRRSTPPRTAQPVRYVQERGGTAMYGTEMTQGEFRRQRRGHRWRDSEAEGEFPSSLMPQFGGGYGWHHRRRRRWADWEGEGHPAGYGAGEQQFLPLLPLIGSVLGGLLKEAEAEAMGEYGEAGYGETGYGPGEYGEAGYGETGYGPGEYGEAEYGETEYGEAEYGEAEYSESGYGPGEYGEAEYGEAEYGETEYGEAEYGEGEGEYGETGYGPGEYGEAEFGEGEQGPGEYGEAEYGETEQFLGGIVGKILGGEAEQPWSALSPAREAQLASRLLEITGEDELENFLGNIVNLVGRAVGGIKDFARSSVGRAVVQAVAPLAKSVLPMAGAAIGSAIAPGIGTGLGRALGTAASSIFEVGEAVGEQTEYELARRVVQLTSAAARSAALAPPGAPPEVVGELAVFHEARHFAPGFYRRAVNRFRPHVGRLSGAGFARRPGRYYGGRYGQPWGRYYAGRYGRPWGRYYGGRYGRPWGRWYGSYAPSMDSEPAPDTGQPPEGPPPPGPGYRWVAVPIDAPGPAGPGPGGPPGPGAPAGPGGPGSPGGPPSDQGEVPRWGRRPGRGRGYGA